MPFIDDTSLQELKAKVWEEGYAANSLERVSMMHMPNPYTNDRPFTGLRTESEVSIESYKDLAIAVAFADSAVHVNYCPEGDCNED